MRRLLVVLGDQLDSRAPLLTDADPDHDAVWMCESPHEATKVWSHRARIALFLAAMRHFARALREQGFTVFYRRLGAHDVDSLDGALASDLARLRPASVHMTQPGEHEVLLRLRGAAEAAGVPLRLHDDSHFFCAMPEFRDWLQGRRQPRMEHFYRRMRQKTGLLMVNGQPAGGRWNFDADNRASFGKSGPGMLPSPQTFAPDALSRSALDDVARLFPDHPGSLDAFDWPVTRQQALAALEDFVSYRLPDFGRFQDAMWTGQPWLYHARLSAALNLKLLDPREVCEAAEQAWLAGKAPIAAVEGFVRQVLGWREYVRGLYWARMPGYRDENALGADEPLPRFYWTGDTDMACLRHTLEQTLQHGYAHHIQRLMVTGLYALLLGVRPRAVHEWYLAVYVDAVEWVELPNVLGMSQWADGGFMASKPYIASGKYLDRMSDYCRGCAFDPGQATGATACPFTTLYWDFLDRHEARFAGHPRLKMQVNNLRRKSASDREAIREAAQRHRAGLRSSDR